MKPISKLKNQARLCELNEDWEKAIGLYLQVLSMGDQFDAEADLSLLNRIGDLYLRLDRPDDAVAYYEKAAERYAEAGLYNNAIALCNKALRYVPGRLELYRRLGQLSASQGFLTDARRWFLQYAERKLEAGELDDAFSALSDFAELSEDAEVREMLGRKLYAHGRPREAVDELTKAYALRVNAGQSHRAEALRAEIARIEPSAVGELEGAVEEAATRPVSGAGPAESVPLPGLGLESAAGAAGLTEEAHDRVVEVGPELGLEPTALVPAEDKGEEEATAADAAEAEADEDGVATAQDDKGAVAEQEEEEAVVAEQEEQQEEAAVVAEEEEEEAVVAEQEEAPAAEQEERASAVGSEEEIAVVEAEEEPGVVAREEEAAPAEQARDLEPEAVPDVEAAEELAGAGEALDEITAEEPAPLPLLGVEPEAGDEEATELAPPLPLLESAGGEQEQPDEAGVEASQAAEATVEGEAAAVGPEAGLPDLDSAVAEAREQLARGERALALQGLEALHTAYAEAGDTARASVAVEELLRIDRENVVAHQRRVEYAFRSRDREGLVEACLELAACLGRRGEDAKARVVYKRVLDLDPDNRTAAEALRPDGRGRRRAKEYVDLTAFLEPDEEAGERTTRFVVEEKAPSGDEAQDFAELLSQFKAKVSEGVGEDDPASHYDLGLAFKDMGLLDDAIGEFQVALRGGQERLMVYEELGQCFMLKEQYNVALKVLERAVQLPHEDDTELTGVYYHLGRCHEELGQPEQARDAYERVMGVDVRFRDVAERLARL